MPRMSRQQSGLRFGFNPVVEPNVVSGEFNGHSELPRTPNTTSTEIGQAGDLLPDGEVWPKKRQDFALVRFPHVSECAARGAPDAC